MPDPSPAHQAHYVNHMIRSSTTEEDDSVFVNTISPLDVQQHNEYELIYDDNMTTKKQGNTEIEEEPIYENNTHHRPLQQHNNEETNNHDTMSNHDDETDGEDCKEYC